MQHDEIQTLVAKQLAREDGYLLLAKAFGTTGKRFVNYGRHTGWSPTGFPIIETEDGYMTGEPGVITPDDEPLSTFGPRFARFRTEELRREYREARRAEWDFGFQRVPCAWCGRCRIHDPTRTFGSMRLVDTVVHRTRRLGLHRMCAEQMRMTVDGRLILERTLQMVDAPKTAEEFATADYSDESQQKSMAEATRANLDRLDKLLLLDDTAHYEPETVDAARFCVMQVMNDLRAHPELDSILLDGDVRNIIHFIRITHQTFEIRTAEKKVKAVTKAKKPQNKLQTNAAFTSSLGRFLKKRIADSGGLTKAIAPKTAEEFANMVSQKPEVDALDAALAKMGMPVKEKKND